MELSNGSDIHLLDIELLWASVEHWLENWQDPAKATMDDLNCPLCAEYLTTWSTCLGCPVMVDTGHEDCRETPWRAANEARRDYHYRWNEERYEALQAAIEDEYVYLVELALSYSRSYQRRIAA